MISLAPVLAASASCAWGLAAAIARRNHRYAPCIAEEPAIQSTDSLCVVIPARDEERNIGPCLEALCRSAHPRLRIRVVDDGSTDRTAEIALEWASRDARVEVVQLHELPAGWLGKNHAAWRGASGGNEDWFLFVDADLRVAPSCLSQAMAAAIRLDADLLTLVPELEMRTFWEIAVQPVVAHMILLSLDTRAINRDENPQAAAMGPFLLFRREAYERIGGHQAVRSEVVEDLRLAEAVKRAGLRLVLARGSGVASLRMYHSLQAIVAGWSKNFHVAIRGRLAVLPFAVAALLFFFCTPWIVPLIALVTGDLRGVVAGGLAAGVALLVRRDLERLYDVPARRAYLSALGAVVVAWILTTSVLSASRGKPVFWKGRSVPIARKRLDAYDA